MTMAEHISLVPSVSVGKTKLRTDGVYVQFGTRPWWSYNRLAYEKWYNIIRVFDDKHLITLGCSATPFCFIDNDDPVPDHKDLGITDPTNVLQTVQEFSKITIDEFFDRNKPCKFRGIPGYFEAFKEKTYSTWHLISPISDDEHDKGSKDLGWVQSTYCNDDFTIYYKKDVNILYDYGSPGRIEYDDDDNKVCHKFPAYFIPFDLSEKNRWETVLDKWNKFVPS